MTVLAGDILFLPEEEDAECNSFYEKCWEDLRYFDEFDENKPKMFTYNILVNSKRESITLRPEDLHPGYDPKFTNQLLIMGEEYVKPRRFAVEIKKFFQEHDEMSYKVLLETAKFRRCMTMVVLAKYLEKIETLDWPFRERLLMKRGFHLPRRCVNKESDEVRTMCYIERVYEFFLSIMNLYIKHNALFDSNGLPKTIVKESVPMFTQRTKKPKPIERLEPRIKRKKNEIAVSSNEQYRAPVLRRQNYPEASESYGELDLPITRTNTFWNGLMRENPEIVPYKSLLVEAERVLIRITESRTLVDGTYVGLSEPKRRIPILKYEACQSLGIFKQPVGLDEALKEVELRKAQIEAFKKQNETKSACFSGYSPVRGPTLEQRIEQKRLRDSFNLGHTDMAEKLATARATIGGTLLSWGIALPKREETKIDTSGNDDLIEREIKKMLENPNLDYLEKTEKKKMSKKEKAREAKREEERWLNLYKDITIYEVSPQNMGDFIYANMDKGKTKYAEYIRYLWPTYITDMDKKQEFIDKTKQPTGKFAVSQTEILDKSVIEIGCEQEYEEHEADETCEEERENEDGVEDEETEEGSDGEDGGVEGDEENEDEENEDEEAGDNEEYEDEGEKEEAFKDKLMKRRFSDWYDAHFVRTGVRRRNCRGCRFDDIQESEEEDDMDFPHYHIRDEGHGSQRIIKSYLASRDRPLKENGEEQSDPEEDEGHKLVEKIWNSLASKLPCDDLISLLMDRSVICEKPTVAALRAAKRGQKLRIKDVAEANSQQKQIDIMQKCSEFLLHRRAIESGIEDRYRGKIREVPDWNDPQIDEIKARLILAHPEDVTDVKSINEEIEATLDEDRKSRVPTAEEKRVESKMSLEIMWKRFKRYEKAMKMYFMGQVQFPENCTVDEESCRCVHCTMKYKYPPTPESLNIKKKR